MIVRLLLDTHFLLWIVLGSDRLREFPWLDRYRPWWVSPISLLEIQFLSEVGRVQASNPGFTDAVFADPRFVVDEVPITNLVLHAVALSWTRDPFDRLIVAHSLARRVPLASVDERVLKHHRGLPAELS